MLARGGAEGVARGQQHRFALALEIFGQFADRGGFARAVDAGEHNHKRFLARGNFQRLLQGLDELVNGIFERATQFVAVFKAFEAHAFAHVFHQIIGGFDAHIAGDQHGFELFIQIFVDLAAAKHAGQRFGHLVARFGEALFEARRPAGFGRLFGSGLLGCGRCGGNRHGGGHGGDAVGLFERIGCGMAAQFGRRGFGRGLRHMNSAHRRFGVELLGQLVAAPHHIGHQLAHRVAGGIFGHGFARVFAQRLRLLEFGHGHGNVAGLGVYVHMRGDGRRGFGFRRPLGRFGGGFGRIRRQGFGRMGFGVGDVVGKAAQRMRGGIGGHGFARVFAQGLRLLEFGHRHGNVAGLGVRVLGRCNGRCGFGRFNRLGVLLGRGFGRFRFFLAFEKAEHGFPSD